MSNINKKWGKLPAYVKNDLRVALIAGISAILTTVAVANLDCSTSSLKQKYSSWIAKGRAMLNNKIDTTSYFRNEIQALHELKVQELDRCMQDKMRYFRGPKNYDPNEIQLSAEELITQCESYGYDPILAAAQTWNETKCGTSNRARRTNSAFSVGCMDNGKNTAIYSDVNASIEPYIQLMQNDYGINDDTLTAIFNGTRKLVNTAGYRYATDANYEATLKRTYNSIKKKYPVLSWTLKDYLNSVSVN